MTLFQLLMLGASAYFAYKIYEHVQTLEDKNGNNFSNNADEMPSQNRAVTSFSTLTSQELIEKADDAFQNDDKEKALALLLEAIQQEPDNSEALFKVGYILQKQDDNEGALDYYKKALEFDEQNEFIHNSVASIYRANKEFTSAKMHLNRSLELDDKNPITYYNYGNLLVDMQNPEGAKGMYEKALELDPEFEEARRELENLADI